MEANAMGKMWFENLLPRPAGSGQLNAEELEDRLDLTGLASSRPDLETAGRILALAGEEARQSPEFWFWVGYWQARAEEHFYRT
jgi:hypothetical protein